MRNKLTLKELQYLDAFLKYMCNYPSVNHQINIIFKDDGKLLTGDFFIYKDGSPSICKVGYRNSYRVDDIHLDFDNAMEKYNSLYGSYNKDVIIRNLSHIDTFIDRLLSSNFFDACTNLLDDVPPYLYAPIFYDSNMPKLDFYILDKDKTYEIVSILCTSAQK